MLVEHHSYPNSDWVRFESEKQDDKKEPLEAVNFVGIKEFDIIYGENGAAVAPPLEIEASDADGVATIKRFKTVFHPSELVRKVKKTDPTKPTGATVTPVSSSTVGQPAAATK